MQTRGFVVFISVQNSTVIQAVHDLIPTLAEQKRRWGEIDCTQLTFGAHVNLTALPQAGEMTC